MPNILLALARGSWVLVLILGMTPPAFAEGSVPVRDGRGAVAPRPERKIVGYATPRPISSADRARYAAREAASPGAKRYQGGGAVIIISASALAVILLVVLLIVLL